MNAEAKEFIETERMMSEVKEHYIMQGMWNAYNLLRDKKISRQDEGRPISADTKQWHEGFDEGFAEAINLLYKHCAQLEV